MRNDLCTVLWLAGWFHNSAESAERRRRNICSTRLKRSLRWKMNDDESRSSLFGFNSFVSWSGHLLKRDCSRNLESHWNQFPSNLSESNNCSRHPVICEHFPTCHMQFRPHGNMILQYSGESVDSTAHYGVWNVNGLLAHVYVGNRVPNMCGEEGKWGWHWCILTILMLNELTRKCRKIRPLPGGFQGPSWVFSFFSCFSSCLPWMRVVI